MDGTKVALASSLTIPFSISWLTRIYLLLSNRDLPTYVSRPFLPVMLPFLWAHLAVHAALLLIGLGLRRARVARASWLVHLEIQIWFVFASLALYATGSLTSPLVILVVVLPVLGYLLFPPRPMHFGIATLTVGTLAGGLLPLTGRVPYAPFLARAPFADHVIEPFWVLAFGIPTLFSAAMGVAVHIHLVDQLRARQLELERVGNTDALTGLANRATFYLRLSEEVARARRHGHPLTLLMIDADHFKSVNDVGGHVAGDRVLKELAAGIQGALRKGDFPARYGGEEFAVLLPHTQLTDATVVAERLLRNARSVVRPPTPTDGATRLTISVGAAELGDSERAEDVVLRADDALYRSKAAGRDRLTID